MYVQAGLAILSLIGGYMQAQNAKAGAGAKADEYERLIEDTKLTHKFNEQERNKATYQMQLSALRGGVDKAGMAGLAGKKQVESLIAETASSGVALGSGTAREVVANQHLQNANQQLAIMDQTKGKIDHIVDNAMAVNKMETFKANMQMAKYQRAASMARRTGETMFNAHMFGAFTSAAGTYQNAGGEWPSDATIKGWFS
tara:strand:+ start:2995 stop:3594 length:600 start_codon:yes stop_codon:yes gene_type:complete